MPCTGSRYATAEEYSKLLCGDWPASAEEQDKIEHVLDLSVAPIEFALSSVGACDCTFSATATRGIAYLNCLLAAATHVCPCSTVEVDDEQRRAYAKAAKDMLDRIASGEWEVCAGETGKNLPVFRVAQQSLTPWSAAQLIINTEKENA